MTNQQKTNLIEHKHRYLMSAVSYPETIDHCKKQIAKINLKLRGVKC